MAVTWESRCVNIALREVRQHSLCSNIRLYNNYILGIEKRNPEFLTDFFPKTEIISPDVRNYRPSGIQIIVIEKNLHFVLIFCNVKCLGKQRTHPAEKLSIIKWDLYCGVIITNNPYIYVGKTFFKCESTFLLLA